jgi:superfamily I DNA/RNA helicase
MVWEPTRRMGRAPQDQRPTGPAAEARPQQRDRGGPEWRALLPPEGHDWEAAYRKVYGRLNDQQRAIADRMASDDGVNVRAPCPAGAGKTATLVAGLSKVLNDGVLRPEDVMLTTFTKKASIEMSMRLYACIPREFVARLNDPLRRIGTFHGIAGVWMAKHDPQMPAHRWRIPKNVTFAPYGKIKEHGFPNAQQMWDSILDEPTYENGRPKPVPWFLEEPRRKVGRWCIGTRNHLGVVKPPKSEWRDYQLAVDVIRSAGFLPEDVEGERRARALEERLPGLFDAWRLYHLVLDVIGGWDASMVLHDYWKRGTDTARLVIVDEAQDDDTVQLSLAKEIAERTFGRTYLIGDVRQSIFGWRGANPSIFIHADTLLNAATMEITTNYRSGSSIVLLGNTVVQGADWVVGSPAVSARRDVAQREVTLGERTYLLGTKSGAEGTIAPTGHVRTLAAGSPLGEVQAVADEIKVLVQQGVSPESIAILRRTNAECAMSEVGLLMRGIPVIRWGAKRSFFESSPADAVVRMLQGVVHNDRDALAKSLRVLFSWADGTYPIGQELTGARPDEDVIGVVRRAGYDGARIADVLDKLRRAHTHSWKLLATLACAMAAPMVRGLPPSGFKIEGGVFQVPAATWDDDVGLDTSDDTDNEKLEALGLILTFFESADDFFTFERHLAQDVLSFTAEMGAEERRHFEEERKRRVIVSSLHRSKGLEWPIVYVSSTHNKFPHIRTVGDPEREEEERRLFYVGVSRAADIVTCSYSMADEAGRDAGPSVFIERYVLSVQEQLEPPEHDVDADDVLLDDEPPVGITTAVVVLPAMPEPAAPVEIDIPPELDDGGDAAVFTLTDDLPQLPPWGPPYLDTGLPDRVSPGIRALHGALLSALELLAGGAQAVTVMPSPPWDPWQPLQLSWSTWPGSASGAIEHGIATHGIRMAHIASDHVTDPDAFLALSAADHKLAGFYLTFLRVGGGLPEPKSDQRFGLTWARNLREQGFTETLQGRRGHYSVIRDGLVTSYEPVEVQGATQAALFDAFLSRVGTADVEVHDVSAPDPAVWFRRGSTRLTWSITGADPAAPVPGAVSVRVEVDATALPRGMRRPRDIAGKPLAEALDSIASWLTGHAAALAAVPIVDPEPPTPEVPGPEPVRTIVQDVGTEPVDAQGAVGTAAEGMARRFLAWIETQGEVAPGVHGSTLATVLRRAEHSVVYGRILSWLVAPAARRAPMWTRLPDLRYASGEHPRIHLLMGVMDAEGRRTTQEIGTLAYNAGASVREALLRPGSVILVVQPRSGPVLFSLYQIGTDPAADDRGLVQTIETYEETPAVVLHPEGPEARVMRERRARVGAMLLQAYEDDALGHVLAPLAAGGVLDPRELRVVRAAYEASGGLTFQPSGTGIEAAVLRMKGLKEKVQAGGLKVQHAPAAPTPPDAWRPEMITVQAVPVALLRKLVALGILSDVPGGGYQFIV